MSWLAIDKVLTTSPTVRIPLSSAVFLVHQLEVVTCLLVCTYHLLKLTRNSGEVRTGFRPSLMEFEAGGPD